MRSQGFRPRSVVPRSVGSASDSEFKDTKGGGEAPKAFSKQELDRSIPGLTGKRVVFVTDDRDMHIENVVTNMVLHEAGAGKESCPMGYSNFLTKALEADILILRSSRIFKLKTDTLIESLERFRAGNPKSAVIVCSFEREIIDKLQPLAESGVINLIYDGHPCEDQSMLVTGARLFQKL